MNTIAKSIIAKRFGAMLAIGLAGAVLAGSVAPAAAGKHGGGKGGHHHGQQQPKPPKVTSQPMPLPPPVIKHVRDHRTPKPCAESCAIIARPSLCRWSAIIALPRRSPRTARVRGRRRSRSPASRSSR